MSSNTRIVRSDRLLEDREIASVFLRLMMAVNDGGLANNALVEWDQTTERKKKCRYNGGRMYFVRVQLGHVFEALGVVDEIKASNVLRDLIEKADSATQVSFKKLEEFRSTPEYKVLVRLRNNLSFHYNGKLAIRGLERVVAARPEDLSAMSFGDDILDWHFQLADKVMNSIFARDVMGLGQDADVVKESNEIMHRLFDLHEALADFSMHFIRHYFKKR
jgi:hypothetical protein